MGLLALCVATMVQWIGPAPIQWLDEGIRDMMVRLGARQTQETRIAVIDIDEHSLAELGPWPWSRAKVADLIESLLLDQNVRAVGLDIVFPQPADVPGDARIAALASHAALAMAQILDYTSRADLLKQGLLAGGEKKGFYVAAATAKGFIANHAGLSMAHCVGNIGYVPDDDGILRRIPTVTRYDGLYYPSLSQALVGCTHGSAAAIAPSDAQGMWRVPYSVAQEAYTVVSAADVLQQRIPAGLLKDRFVLVGSSGLGLGDHVSTPLSALTAGVMVHAATLTGLLDLQEGRLHAPSNGAVWLLLWCGLTFGLTVWILPRFSAWAGTAFLTGLAMAWMGVAFAGVRLQVEWSVTAPLWGYALLLVLAMPYEWWRSQNHTRRLMTTLSHYVAKPVLDEIMRRHLQYSLEPSLKHVTVLVADMEGYTRLTSSMPLNDAAELTKSFLDCLTRPVLEHQGTLDKYTGDGLVAFWGAPLPREDQADAAVAAALQILQSVRLLNDQRATLGEPPALVRIGIESGTALVGDLGTDFRSTYTAVGDCINFASRLESAAKDLGTPLLLGPMAARSLQCFETYGMGTVHLRNTDTSIEIFTLKSLISASMAPRITHHV